MHTTHTGTLALITVVILLAVIGLARPRLLLMPVVALFATWGWLKTILLLPVNFHEWLVASALEKNATALAAHAQAAAALWMANTEFRPAAREVFGRVVMGYGIRPSAPPPLLDEHPPADAFDQSRVMAAAAGVQNSRGKPVTKIEDGKVASS